MLDLPFDADNKASGELKWHTENGTLRHLAEPHLIEQIVYP